jgi:hypothetical protein
MKIANEDAINRRGKLIRIIFDNPDGRVLLQAMLDELHPKFDSDPMKIAYYQGQYDPWRQIELMLEEGTSNG